MAYLCELSPNQKVYFDLQANQTVVTAVSSSPGQQQQSSNSFTTGSWTSPPQVYRHGGGITIEIEAAGGKSYINVQGNSIGIVNHSPSESRSETLQVQEVSGVPLVEMSPMKPMQPMKMGNMEMNMNPMKMRMENMEMRMNSAENSPSKTLNFCSQCGTSVKAEDRFCSNCGYRLGS